MDQSFLPKVQFVAKMYQFLCYGRECLKVLINPDFDIPIHCVKLNDRAAAI